MICTNICTVDLERAIKTPCYSPDCLSFMMSYEGVDCDNRCVWMITNCVFIYYVRFLVFLLRFISFYNIIIDNLWVSFARPLTCSNLQLFITTQSRYTHLYTNTHYNHSKYVHVTGDTLHKVYIALTVFKYRWCIEVGNICSNAFGNN